jgi:hypothetical protein
VTKKSKLLKPLDVTLPSMIDCQSFREGCCGCCVNMRWRPERVLAYLEANTRAFRSLASPRPCFRELVRIHWSRRGWRDHLLVTVLAPLTFGLTAWLWMRLYGSCCFAGFLDGPGRRAGCLIHPERVGMPDLRRHAFPMIPVLGCNRALRCPMLDQNPAAPTDGDLITVSRAGSQSLRKGRRTHRKN